MAGAKELVMTPSEITEREVSIDRAATRSCPDAKANWCEHRAHTTGGGIVCVMKA